MRVVAAALGAILFIGACAPAAKDADARERVPGTKVIIPPDYLDMTKAEYARKVTLFERSRRQPGATLFIGDSITEFGDWARRFPDRYIINFGISGDQSTGLLNRLSQIERVRPGCVLLMIGTNDIGMLRRPAAEIAGNVRAILKRLKKVTPADKILLQSILPREARFDSYVRDLNVELQKTAADEGVAFIDLYTPFLGEGPHIDPALSIDMVHLNEAGYARWARLIEPWLSSE